jgi:hypothetical protein
MDTLRDFDNLLEETGRPRKKKSWTILNLWACVWTNGRSLEFNYREKWTALAEANHRASESEVKDYVVSNLVYRYRVPYLHHTNTAPSPNS